MTEFHHRPGVDGGGLAERRRSQFTNIRHRLIRGVTDGVTAAVAGLAAIARYYTTVMQPLSVQASDGGLALVLGGHRHAFPAHRG